MTERKNKSEISDDRSISRESSVKRRVFQIVGKTEEGDRVGALFDGAIIFLIILSVVCIVLESFHEIARDYGRVFFALEVFTVVIFTLEYLARLWTADLLYPKSRFPRLRYVFSFMALVDLAAFLPFYLPIGRLDLRYLRLFRLTRLLRIFKLHRYSSAFQMVTEVIVESSYQLFASFSLLAITILVSAIVMYGAERTAQPDAFPNVPAAIWWAVVSIATVGYGDVYPITVVGKIFGSIISVVGIGVVAIPAGVMAAGFSQAIARRKEGETDKKKYCPYCGKKIDD